MQRLQRSRESLEERSTADRIREGVYRRDEEIECDAPICQDGEVGKRSFGCLATALGFVGTSPTDNEESSSESVGRLLATQLAREEGWDSLVGGLTMRARQKNNSHGLSNHDVSKRWDGSHRSVPNLNGFFAISAMIELLEALSIEVRTKGSGFCLLLFLFVDLRRQHSPPVVVTGV